MEELFEVCKRSTSTCERTERLNKSTFCVKFGAATDGMSGHPHTPSWRSILDDVKLKAILAEHFDVLRSHQLVRRSQLQHFGAIVQSQPIPVRYIAKIQSYLMSC